MLKIICLFFAASVASALNLGTTSPVDGLDEWVARRRTAGSSDAADAPTSETTDENGAAAATADAAIDEAVEWDTTANGNVVVDPPMVRARRNDTVPRAMMVSFAFFAVVFAVLFAPLIRQVAGQIAEYNQELVALQDHYDDSGRCDGTVCEFSSPLDIVEAMQ